MLPVLGQEISLWSGGPGVTLGDFFLLFRYTFCLLFVGWAVLVLYRPKSSFLLGGALFFSGLGLLGFSSPLGRPYGLVDHGAALEELGLPMVTASTGTPSASRLVDAPNPMPCWSLLVGASSGMEPGWLLGLYRFVPLAVLIFLGAAVYLAVGALSPAGDRFPAALAAFFALLVSSPRLGYMEGQSSLWTDAVWLRPRVGLALALGLLAFRWIALGRGWIDRLIAGVLMGLCGWMEPRCLLLGALGVVLFGVLQWRRREPFGRDAVTLVIAAAVFLSWPSWGSSAVGDAAAGTWYGVLQDLYAVSFDRGAVFLLALLGAVQLHRSGKRSQSLLLGWLASAYALWIVVSVSSEASRVLDSAIVRSVLTVYLAAVAGWAAHGVLMRVESWWARSGAVSTYALALAGLLLVSLPWAFPFWYAPSRMDELYRESVEPVAPEFLAFGEWIRDNTPGDAVFVTGPSYAPWIPVLSGRRVLSNLEDVSVAHAAERELATAWIATSRDPAKIRTAVRRWGVSYLAWGRLDEEGPRSEDIDYMESSPMFRLVHRQRRWVSVFELSPDGF